MTSAILVLVFVVATGTTSQSVELPTMSSCEVTGKQIVQEITAKAEADRRTMYATYSCSNGRQY